MAGSLAFAGLEFTTWALGEDLRSTQVQQMLLDFSGEGWSRPPPLVAARAADILLEPGRSGLVADDEALQEVWDKFRTDSCFRKKGSKVHVFNFELEFKVSVALSLGGASAQTAAHA